MNRTHLAVSKSKSILSLSATLFVSGLLVLSSQGQTPVNSQTLTDGNTSAKVDVGSSMGMYDWNVGGLGQLKQQWFWYRVGGGAQSSIDTISAPSMSRPTGNNSLNTTYANGTLDVMVDYVLTDQGTGLADISEAISIHNPGANPLTLSFFQYSNFDLNGTPNGEEVWVGPNLAFQQEGDSGIAEGIVTPDATYFEANTVGGAGSTLNKLMTQPGLNLNNNDNASGDPTWAFQWDLTIAAGDTVLVLKDKQLWTVSVPEPSAFALIGLGLTACGLSRRRQ